MAKNEATVRRGARSKLDHGRNTTVAEISILVVDDVEANRQLLARFYRKRGFHILMAASGAEALGVIDEQPVDLVLLDIMMPEMDGMETLRRIRQKYTAGELPVIMVTALDQQANIVESIQQGANDYITKPIDLPVLSARSESQLQRKRAEDTVRRMNEQLEQRVQDRTAELRRAYNVLKEESEERVRAQAMLLQSEEKYRMLYDDNPSTFLTIDSAGTLISVNQFGASQLGYEIDELVGRNLKAIHPAIDQELVVGAIKECFANPESPKTWEVRMLHKDGSSTWSRSTGKAVANKDRSVNVLVVCEDISETRHLSEQLSFEASHDSLTGLYNRREFEIRLRRALDATQVGDAKQHMLFYVDLDQFKVINDNCGHVAGDELLRQLANAVKDQMRSGDTLARLGGDEFGVLLLDCPMDNAKMLAAELLQSICDFRFAWDGRGYTIGASIGVVQINKDSKDITEILIAADAACYAAKDSGRNRVHVFEPDDEELAQRHGEMQWVIKIKRALEQDRFRLFAQPIVPVDNEANQSPHYEVLIRMLDEDDKLVPPGAFLPAAERYNISGNVDRWVVRSTLRWLSEHSEHVTILGLCSINLSGQSLGDESFLSDIMASFPEFGVPADKICFEITETAAIANLQTATNFIQTLRELGCKFALDDFGSGLSSFAYLRNLPVDYLKIDGLFVKNIADDLVNRAMVNSINEVGHVMGKKTIAEFVENDAIVAILEEIGVDYAQGYGIGKPVPIDEIL